MIRSLCLAAMLLFVGASSVSAAAVSFRGVINSRIPATGGSFGLSPGATFTGGLYVLDSVSSSSSIIGGRFDFSNGLTIFVNSGTVSITGSTVDFSMLAANSATTPLSSILFSFTSVPGIGSSINSAELDKLAWRTTSFNLFEGGGVPFYEGTITAVPEPSSMLALAGLAVGGLGYRWRKRRLASKA